MCEREREIEKPMQSCFQEGYDTDVNLTSCQHHRLVFKRMLEIETEGGGEVDFDLTQCPISKARMKDPVLAPDGHTYDRHYIEAWLQTRNVSPITGDVFPEQFALLPNVALLKTIAFLNTLDCDV